MKKLFTTFALIFFISSLNLHAQSQLYIHAPHNTWYGQSGGDILEASIMIEPKGAYMEVGMILTVAPSEPYWYSDQLEIVMDFNLPEGSIIHDSWLWMEDDTTIVKADVLEYWDALSIYEGIVNVQQDPSILHKKPEGDYRIRIYPLAWDHYRKFKITYLVPAKWSQTEVSAYLPVDILKLSQNPVTSIDLYTVTDPTWLNPRISPDDGIGFVTFFDPELGNILYADLQNLNFDQPLEFIVDAPFNGQNYFVSSHIDGDENFYQIAYLPPPVTTETKKIAFLFDHESINTFYDKAQLFDFVNDHIQENLTPQDEYNMFFSKQSGIEQLSNTWLPADFSGNSILLPGDDPINNYSRLKELLIEAIHFVKNNGGEGEILLFTSSDNTNWNNWESEVNDVLDELDGADIPISIVDYQTYYFYFILQGGQTIYGSRNLRFYQEIASNTNGQLFSTSNGENMVWENIQSAILSAKYETYSYDLNPDLENGFTYDRYYQTYLGQSLFPGKPIIQVGKYFGDFPLDLEFSYLSDNQVIHEDITVNSAEIFTGDTISREIWVGNHLEFLDSGSPTYSEVLNIIDISKTERVLSNYTAFLALDLINGGEPCPVCLEAGGNGGGTTSIINPEESKINASITAFPNPFSEFCQIQIELPDSNNFEDIQVVITDLMGKTLKTIDASNLISQGHLTINWNGDDAKGNMLPSGMYLLSVITDLGTETIKLNVVR